ncbi:hypothetical protein NQZ68_008592 [Dissostichus eleginoides]|nr:hypothetical protein NQZ68_008592 [Dissostichus eleginoides]
MQEALRGARGRWRPDRGEIDRRGWEPWWRSQPEQRSEQEGGGGRQLLQPHIKPFHCSTSWDGGPALTTGGASARYRGPSAHYRGPNARGPIAHYRGPSAHYRGPTAHY